MPFTSGAALALTALLLAVVALAAVVPGFLIRRGQDSLAREILARPPGADRCELLTRAGKFVGTYRRLPGVLGLTRSKVVFENRFEPRLEIPLAEVRKISTGKLLSTGRRLFRDEVLAITDASGRLFEFQMPHASCYQWRQHLGAWGARQRGKPEADNTGGASP